MEPTLPPTNTGKVSEMIKFFETQTSFKSTNQQIEVLDLHVERNDSEETSEQIKNRFDKYLRLDVHESDPWIKTGLGRFVILEVNLEKPHCFFNRFF